jgi:ATP-dependent DNA helicase RecG
LKLTEGKCTGIPTILKSMKNNGSPEPMFETDDDRQSLLVTIPVHNVFFGTNFTTPIISTMVLKILKICAVQPTSKSDIAAELKISPNSGTLKRLLPTLISRSLLEYTIPNKPNSSLQKYRITLLGYGSLGLE